MAVEKEARIKLVFDGSQATQGIKEAGRSFTDLNQGLELVKKGVGAFQAAYGTLVAAIDAGQQFDELNGAFNELYGSAGALASDGIPKLRTAVGGLISDVDLLKEANLAAQAGLKPDQFLALAKAADHLGDVVGKNTKEALGDLTQALATGNDRALKQYGILIDNAKAEDKFAKSIGVTRDALNEVGKAQAVREAFFERLPSLMGKAGDGAETAGDAIQRLNASFENSKASIGHLLNNLTVVGDFFRGLEIIISKTTKALEDFFAGPTKAQQLATLQKQLGSADQLLQGSFFSSDTRKEVEASRAQILVSIEALKNFKEETVGVTEAQKSLAPSLNQSKESFIDQGKGADEAKKKAAELRKEYEGLAKTIEEKKLTDAFADSIKFQDAGSFAALEDKLYESVKSGFDKFVKAVPQSDLDKSIADAFQVALVPFEKDLEKAYEDAAQKQKETLEENASFFGDVLSAAIDGTSEDFTKIAKQFGIDFASQGLALAAQSIFPSFSAGKGGIGGIASGLATSIFGSLFGGGKSIAAGTTGVGPVASGSAYGAAIGGGAAGGLFGLGTLGSLGIGAGVLALPSLLGFAGKLFGGSTDKDTLGRRGIRGQLEQLLGSGNNFGSVNGNVRINDLDFKKGAPTGSSAGLASPLANIFAGGGKFGDDFTNIFAQAIGNAKNYNEEIVNTLSLMGKLKINAGEAKDQLSQLFLDGKVSLDEFSSGIANLNLLAQEDLVGKDSVSDAINIMTKNISTNPRVALQGLALAFKEMQQQGITSSSAISNYLSGKFEPSVVGVFQALTASGLDTFSEIKNASADQLVIIVNALKGLKDAFKDSIGGGAQDAADSVRSATEDIRANLGIIAEDAKNTGKALNSVGGKSGSNSRNGAGVDPNPTNATHGI